MKFKTVNSILLVLFCLLGLNFQNQASVAIRGVKRPVISLNGTWKFSMNPPEKFWEQRIDFKSWTDIKVPGECQMQGFAIKHDKPYAYKYDFTVPEDYQGKQIQLDFSGVYSYARVWINGQFVREHFGGFTKWSCDITDFVSAGKSANLSVEITDRADDISYESGYAKHQIGGILRDVELLALPKQNFKQLYFETDLDENYKNAELKVFYELKRNTSATIKIELFDNQKKRIESVEKEANSPSGQISIQVKNPKKWDAEHPNRYTIVTTLYENKREILQVDQKIGFREIEIKGNKLLVNGMPVKLRGACRHDIHPLLGRMTTPEYDKLDVLLAKEANMNFIRTSHYPPSEAFLNYCDEYGIYVEDETAVCFVGSHRTEAYQASGASQNDPAYLPKYLSQLKEMVNNHRNHPSVLIWSIGNENTFGANFVESFKWVKKTDTTRPVIYSYPGQVPDSLKIYQILSMHYPDWKGNIDQYNIKTEKFAYKEMPVLYDEWAHVACYTNFELKADPNVRNFWGQSLDSMWINLFDADGALGGAIWGMIDETFMLPRDLDGFNKWWGILDPKVIPASYAGPCVGYGEWGIIDTWRRKKPEFWNTKKAYSPTKIYLRQIDAFEPNMNLTIPVHNRFDQTNLNELKIIWKYGGNSGELKNVDVAPHQKGVLTIPANKWNTIDKLNLRFYQNDTVLIDEYNLQVGKKEISLPVLTKGNLQVNEKGELIKISGNDFLLNVNKKSGLLENLSVGGEVLVESGPYINLKLPGERLQYSTIMMDDYAKNWKCTGFSFDLVDGIASIKTTGVYDSISVSFHTQIDRLGLVIIDYKLANAPVNKDIEELGIKFFTGDAFRTLAWNRDSYFSAYPPNHLGNPSGEVNLTEKPVMNYREKPQHSWEMDTKGFYYLGLNEEFPYTNMARSLKENVYSYALKTGNKSQLELVSSGTQACRFDKIDGENTLIINDKWDYVSLLWGNYMNLNKMPNNFQGRVAFQISKSK